MTETKIQNAAQKLTNHMEQVPVPAAPSPTQTPSRDDDRQHEGILGSAEGQSFMIEYIDSSGNFSRRRITVLEISSGAGGIPCLSAKCHERNSIRDFRIDRIQCFIDFDGEIHENISEFLIETFGMSPLAANIKPDKEQRWKRIISIARPDAVILATMSRIDGRVLECETLAAIDHLAPLVESYGIFLTETEVLSLGNYIKRLRPTQDAITRSLDHLIDQGATSVLSALCAAAKVMDADGVRHPNEVELINEIAIDLTGVGIN